MLVLRSEMSVVKRGIGFVRIFRKAEKAKKRLPGALVYLEICENSCSATLPTTNEGRGMKARASALTVTNSIKAGKLMYVKIIQFHLSFQIQQVFSYPHRCSDRSRK